MTSKNDHPHRGGRRDEEASTAGDATEPVSGWNADDDVEDDVEEWGVEPEEAYWDDADSDEDAPVAAAPVEEDAEATARVSSRPVRLVLSAILIGAVVAAGVMFANGSFRDVGDVASSVIGENLVETDFTRSAAGDCLTWTVNPQGSPTSVNCAEPHRFEVAGVLDTARFPTAEFSATAPRPSTERFAEIRDENCPVIVDRYLGGLLDPAGRFAVGLMYPLQAEWDSGIRGLRCGIEERGAAGSMEEFKGPVADVDQSFNWPDGTCIGINRADRSATSDVVNCAEPHAFQVTGTVDLSQRFGGSRSGKPWPSANDQNEYLRGICPTQTNKFFGGAQQFKATTLNVQWSVISEVSWMTGSRRVACYAALPDRGGFATLVGDARGEALLINGRVPMPPKNDNPGRAVGEPVPLPPGYTPNDAELPAPAGG
ncbi:MAG: septum formation family protein [Gordonia sp. (in: high G+C Gram-positive bacteria)]|uniref:septum formation family protein n=1 Tax=Gordonia sp. (in: high G+C Gram-positive bacteria) TaxID=84139 RepID=UPI003C75C62F